MMKITILGGGAMGTGCSALLGDRSGLNVTLWARNADFVADMHRTRENRRLLPGIRIPDGVTISSDLGMSVQGADMLIAAIPTAFLREGLVAVKPFVSGNPIVVSVIKGLENATFARPSEIIRDVLGASRVVVLGGPSHAEEFSNRMPCSVVAASNDIVAAKQVQDVFTTDRFRVYTNEDIVGVELGGALKNVLAIAVGICDGLGLGDNAKSALMTRGLAEMTRFGSALGADPTTLFGLAGLGDLITTCISRHSRNRHVGEQLGKGQTLDQILSEMSAVAEGVRTTRSVHDLAAKHHLDLPITREVHAVLFEGKHPVAATASLMGRPPKME